MKNKYIKVTVLTTYLSEKGEVKIRSDSNKDQYGYSKEQYEDLNIPIPKDSTIKDDELQEEDLETITSKAFFNVDDFLMVVEHEDTGSTIYLKSGHTLDVLESPKKIIKKINKQ